MRRRWLALFTFLCIGMGLKPGFAVISDIDQVIARFEPKLEAYLNHMPPPGVAIAIVYKGQIRHIICRGTRTYGRADVITEDTVFPVAALAKGFAATLTVLLNHERILSLDDQVIQYLPDLKLHTEFATRQLQVKDLIGQTTGLPSRALGELMDKGQPFEAAITQLPKLPLNHAQGRAFSYQNVVFNLIDPVLRTASDIPYKTLVEERLFKPLRMDSASLGLQALLSARDRITPHTWLKTKQTWVPITPSGPAFDLYAAMGLNASIKDMGNWLVANLQGRRDVISAKSLRQMHQPRTPTPRTLQKLYPFAERLSAASYGLGWSIYRWAGEDVVTQGGLLWGAEHRIAFIPKHQIGIVILCNGLFHPQGEPFWSLGVMATFLDLFLDLPEINWAARIHGILQRARDRTQGQSTEATQSSALPKKTKSKSKKKRHAKPAPCKT
ncbi:MAG: serine hydrolase domain-containing protein [Holosporales bacterium]